MRQSSRRVGAFLTSTPGVWRHDARSDSSADAFGKGSSGDLLRTEALTSQLPLRRLRCGVAGQRRFRSSAAETSEPAGGTPGAPGGAGQHPDAQELQKLKSGAPVHHIDISNFSSAKASLSRALKEASFVCLDCEFTGLSREKQQGLGALRSADQRYQEIRRTLRGRGLTRDDEGNRRQGFLIVQVGLACFSWDAAKKKYDVQAYSFYLSPRPITKVTGNVKVEHDLHFGCLASALSFLSTHGFDFNKWLNHGVPFMSRAAYTAEKNRVQSRGLAGMGLGSGLLADIEEAKGFLDVWDAVLMSGKPLVGHQCLLDILYLWEQLEGPLPRSLSQFLRALSMKVALTIDTKHILSSYPEDMLVALEACASRIQQERLLRSTDLLVTQESRCRELIRAVQKGNGLKGLQLLEVYIMLEPLVRDLVPGIEGDINAHDAGADAYMTGVVYAALHSLIHKSSNPPSADLVLRTHTSESVAPAGAPLAFSYANRLHVFASPFSLYTLGAVPKRQDTHGTTVVVFPPHGGLVDCNRILQVLSSVCPYADLYWIEYQRTAVVNLYRRPGSNDDIVEKFKKSLGSYRWAVVPAVEYVASHLATVRLKRKKLLGPNGQPISSKKSRQKARRRQLASQRKKWLALIRRRINEGTEVEDTLRDTTRLMNQARQQSAQRLTELMEVQKDLKRLQDVERTLHAELEKRNTATATLSELELRHAGLEESKLSLHQEQEALTREKDALSRGLENYRSQADSLRGQVADAFKKVERLERLLSEERAKTDLLNSTVTAVRAQSARHLSERNKAVQQHQKLSKEVKDEEKRQKLRRPKDRPAASAAAPAQQMHDEPEEQETHAPAEAPRDSAPPPPQRDREREPSVRDVGGAGIAPPAGGSKLHKVDEMRPGHWTVANAKANTQILLRVEPKRHQVLEMKDCKGARIFVDGTLSSATFTGCEDVQLYCWSFVSEPGKTWSWGDTSRVSGTKIFYYASDKASIKIYELPQDKWPSQHKQAHLYVSKRMQQYLEESEKRRNKNAVEVTRFVLLLLIILVILQSLSAASIRQNPPLSSDSLDAPRQPNSPESASPFQSAVPPAPPLQQIR